MECELSLPSSDGLNVLSMPSEHTSSSSWSESIGGGVLHSKGGIVLDIIFKATTHTQKPFYFYFVFASLLLHSNFIFFDSYHNITFSVTQSLQTIFHLIAHSVFISLFLLDLTTVSIHMSNILILFLKCHAQIGRGNGTK